MDEGRIVYKIASEPEEMTQIYRLNYETFVEEIPQHERNEQRKLVDKFDQENIYFIAKKAGKVIGMIALRENRPFSLDSKVENLDQYLPKYSKACEVRLLSITKEYRHSRIFYHLMDMLIRYCLKHAYTIMLISGTDRQIKLYKKIGFEPFGELVGTEGALYQPMYLTKEKFEEKADFFSKIMNRKEKEQKTISFMPGPVQVHQKVSDVFNKAPISHRSLEFKEMFQQVKKSLCQLVQSHDVQIAVGTGTMANDMVGFQIKKLAGKGLILANGEFGYRLIDHAKRLHLNFYTIEKEWDKAIQLEEIESFIQNHSDIQWIWMVHCETSTGYLFDLDGMTKLAKKKGIKVCVDACSSVGNIQVDLKNIYMASAVSGKGIGSYPGLALVFHQQSVTPSEEIPRYLDLGQYAIGEATPYTHSSNLVAALQEALNRLDVLDVIEKADLWKMARKKFVDLGFTILGNETYAPGILTVDLPKELPSKKVGDALKSRGILVSYESVYLQKRNWIQFAMMGNLMMNDFEIALNDLQAIVRKEIDFI